MLSERLRESTDYEIAIGLTHIVTNFSDLYSIKLIEKYLSPHSLLTNKRFKFVGMMCDQRSLIYQKENFSKQRFSATPICGCLCSFSVTSTPTLNQINEREIETTFRSNYAT